jgi:hypothetical protein
MKKIIAFIIICFLVLGCGDQIEKGNIINKEFIPAHSYMTMQPIINSNGEITSITYIPITHFISDRYIITIEGYNKNDKKVQQQLYVNKNIYDSYSIGQYYSGDDK